jgi:hypothetical protein
MTYANQHTCVMNFIMEIGSLGGKALGWLFSSGRFFWRRFRYGSWLSLTLSWNRLPITVLGKNNPHWRAIQLQGTASKDEEFVIAKGFLEARKLGSSKWISVEDLGNLLHLPMEIQKNRQVTARIDGSAIVKRLEETFTEDQQIEIRIISEDYHHSRTTSDALVVTLTELSKEEVI